jgi:hypothetical protein
MPLKLEHPSTGRRRRPASVRQCPSRRGSGQCGAGRSGNRYGSSGPPVACGLSGPGGCRRHRRRRTARAGGRARPAARSRGFRGFVREAMAGVLSGSVLWAPRCPTSPMCAARPLAFAAGPRPAEASRSKGSVRLPCGDPLCQAGCRCRYAPGEVAGFRGGGVVEDAAAEPAKLEVPVRHAAQQNPVREDFGDPADTPGVVGELAGLAYPGPFPARTSGPLQGQGIRPRRCGQDGSGRWRGVHPDRSPRRLRCTSGTPRGPFPGRVGARAIGTGRMRAGPGRARRL